MVNDEVQYTELTHLHGRILSNEMTTDVIIEQTDTHTKTFSFFIPQTEV